MRLLGYQKPRILESYEGYQDLEAKNGTKLHYLNQSKYISARNESGGTKKKSVFTIRLKNTCP